MTSFFTPSMNDDDRFRDEWLDRLVDGELSPDEYRQVLQILEQRPDAWKRCALAFLESQAWQGSFAELMCGETAPDHTLAVAEDTSRASRRVSRWTAAATSTALAATVLLAFLSGRWTGMPESNAGRAGRPLVTETQPRNTANLAAQPANGTVAPQKQQFVNNFWSGSPALTPDVRNELRRIGAQVRQDHGYIPLRTVDGRLVLVPYEDVQIVPANRRAY